MTKFRDSFLAKVYKKDNNGIELLDKKIQIKGTFVQGSRKGDYDSLGSNYENDFLIISFKKINSLLSEYYQQKTIKLIVTKSKFGSNIIEEGENDEEEKVTFDSSGDYTYNNFEFLLDHINIYQRRNRKKVYILKLNKDG